MTKAGLPQTLIGYRLDKATCLFTRRLPTSGLPATASRPGTTCMARGRSAAGRISGAGHGAGRGAGQGGVGGHQFFEITAAAPLAKNGCVLGKNQHLGHMAAVGTYKIKKWHVSLLDFQGRCKKSSHRLWFHNNSDVQHIRRKPGSRECSSRAIKRDADIRFRVHPDIQWVHPPICTP